MRGEDARPSAPCQVGECRQRGVSASEVRNQILKCSRAHPVRSDEAEPVEPLGVT